MFNDGVGFGVIINGFGILGVLWVVVVVVACPMGVVHEMGLGVVVVIVLGLEVVLAAIISTCFAVQQALRSLEIYSAWLDLLVSHEKHQTSVSDFPLISSNILLRFFLTAVKLYITFIIYFLSYVISPFLSNLYTW